jgi:hypothetical protein
MTTAIQSDNAAPASRRLPIFYPSQLNVYLECPEKYYHRYVLRRRVSEPFSRALARGTAVHAVLADCFRTFQEQQAFPINLRERVDFHLPEAGYPADQADCWPDDAADVLAQVKWMLAWFDGSARVVGIEETLAYRHGGGSDCDPFLLRAKVDLVLAHSDGTLQHLDFKTGRVQRDPIQEVVARIVVAARYGEEHPTIQTTTLFLGEQHEETEVLTREECRETWQTIKRTVQAILTTTSWHPVASPLCAWCPYFDNGCTLTPAARETAPTAEWLDGVLD